MAQDTLDTVRIDCRTEAETELLERQRREPFLANVITEDET